MKTLIKIATVVFTLLMGSIIAFSQPIAPDPGSDPNPNVDPTLQCSPIDSGLWILLTLALFYVVQQYFRMRKEIKRKRIIVDSIYS
jgi:hypothetical protein